MTEQKILDWMVRHFCENSTVTYIDSKGKRITEYFHDNLMLGISKYAI